MIASESYQYSFRFAGIVQLATLPVLLDALIPGLVLSVVNVIFAMLLYPICFVWFSKRDWGRFVGPQQ